jgi:hypothetical protein
MLVCLLVSQEYNYCLIVLAKISSAYVDNKQQIYDTHVAAVSDTIFSVLIFESVAKLKYLRMTAVNQNYVYGLTESEIKSGSDSFVLLVAI